MIAEPRAIDRFNALPPGQGGVLNAKSGHCTEDCKFCAQSAHNDAEIECYPMVGAQQMVARARESQDATKMGSPATTLAVLMRRATQPTGCVKRPSTLSS